MNWRKNQQQPKNQIPMFFMFSDPYYTDTLRQHALKADISGFAPLHDIQKKTGIGFI